LNYKDHSVEFSRKSRISCLSKDKAECFSLDRMPASTNLSPRQKLRQKKISQYD